MTTHASSKTNVGASPLVSLCRSYFKVPGSLSWIHLAMSVRTSCAYTVSVSMLEQLLATLTRSAFPGLLLKMAMISIWACPVRSWYFDMVIVFLLAKMMSTQGVSRMSD